MSTSQTGASPPRAQRNGFSTSPKPGAAFGIVVLLCSLIALSAVSTSAAAKTRTIPASRDHAASVKPDFAYYRGKTINMIYWGSPGGVGDISSRTLAPYIAAYLHCQVTVQDISGGGTIPGQNASALAPPNGLTIGMLNPAGDIGDFVNNTPGLAFNLRAMPILPSLVAANNVEVVTKASGIKTFKQLVNSTAPVRVIAEANSSNTVESQLLYGAYKIPNRFLYGYSSGAAMLAGFARGDGEATTQGFAVFLPDIVGGIAIPVLQTTPAVKGEAGYTIMKPVPTLTQVVAKDPPKTKDGKAEIQMLANIFAVGTPLWSSQTGTPAKYQAALAAAIEFAASRGGAEKALIAAGDNVGIVQPEVFKKEIVAAINDQAKLRVWLQETGAPPA